MFLREKLLCSVEPDIILIAVSKENSACQEHICWRLGCCFARDPTTIGVHTLCLASSDTL